MATAFFTARVDAVFSRQFTAAIDAPASAGASVLTVVDGGDLDEVGVLLTPWDGATYDYTFDGEVTVTLGEPLLSDAELGETLVVWDSSTSAPVVDTVAHVVPLGAGVSDDVVEARVSFPLIPLLTEGIRSDEDAEAVTVRADGSDYVAAEVLGRAAALTDDFVTDVLVPQLPPLGGGDASDGLAPASNPAVALRAGIGAVFVTWLDVENADRLTYDVRISAPTIVLEGNVSQPSAAILDMQADGTNQSINDQTVSTLSNLTVVSNVGFDTYSGSQAIIPVSGLYLVSFTVTFPAGTSGRRVVDIRKGASSILVRGGEVTTSVTTAIQASLPVYLNAGDDVRGTVYFTGPASLNFVGTYYLQHFTVAKIA